VIESSGANRLSRRRLLGQAAALGSLAWLGGAGQAAAAPRPESARPAPVRAQASMFTFWNGLTGADGRVMDDLIERFTRDTNIRIEQQRQVWPDLYAKLQISVPAGEGPDLMLMHTLEIPHFAADGIIEPMDESALTARGFTGDDYIDAPWQGGVFEGKRYAVPLDVPQHVLYIHEAVCKAAGLAGPDGKVPIPTNRDQLLEMAKKIRSGDTYGLAIGTLDIGRYVWGFHNLLWQNGGNIFTPDLKRAAVTEPAALEVAELWAMLPREVAPPSNANARDAFIAGKLGLWIAGSWNFTGLRDAKVEYVAAKVPAIFKEPIVWTQPHQFTFPVPPNRDEARREAAWTFMRWITDNVADWTLNAGQISAHRRPHSQGAVAESPFFQVIVSQSAYWRQGQLTTRWVKAENATRPIVESIYTGQRQPGEAMQELARQINAIPD